MAVQGQLEGFDAAKPMPDGFVYQPEFVTVDEERDAIELLDSLEFRAITMRGQTAKRTVRHFGLNYDYESRDVVATDPLPSGLEWMRSRCAGLIEREPEDLAQILISRYPEGAGIGWHRDAPMFGSRIAGVSLGAPCRMRFQRGKGDAREVTQIDLEPRSAYVIGGPARWSWQHSIPAAKGLRYSITFRTLKRV
jgi:DNA oxidative demethylase